MPSFNVLSCTGKDAAQWQSLIDQLPLEHRDIMFTPAYARVQNSLDQGNCFAAVYTWQEFFILQPFMLRGQELASFYGGGGPISNLFGKADYRLWLWFEQDFAQWRKEHNITSEYVRLHPHFDKEQRRVLRESTVQVEHLREAVVVDINLDDEKLLKSFSRNHQRGVKEAIKCGVKCESSNDTEQFAKRYQISMERLKANSNWRYASSVWGIYQAELRDYLSILTSEVFGASLLILHAYGKAYAHFLAGYVHNEVLYYESMKYCRDIGCKTYFLGGGTTSEPNDPLLAYKSGFSKLRVPVSYYKRQFAQTDEYVNADGLTALPA